MQRIMIIGQPGSGKSTLARMLGEALDLPVYHMDRDVYWLPGWEERPLEDRLTRIDAIVTQDAWVFEGFNSATFHIRGARADTLIWLDVPLVIRLFRVIRRNVTGLGKARPDLGDDCPERLDMLPGFLWYILRTWRRNWANTYGFYEAFERPKHRLRTVWSVNRFVAQARR
ncbi:MAG: hypothetical protein AAGF71_09795 [Pseudomonadota bacterium]